MKEEIDKSKNPIQENPFNANSPAQTMDTPNVPKDKDNKEEDDLIKEINKAEKMLDEKCPYKEEDDVEEDEKKESISYKDYLGQNKAFLHQAGRVMTEARVYIKSPAEAPPGSNVQPGKRGGFYYDTDGGMGAAKPAEAPAPKSPKAPGAVAPMGGEKPTPSPAPTGEPSGGAGEPSGEPEMQGGDYGNVQDADLIEEWKQMDDLIHNIGTYGVNDVQRLNMIEHELTNRGYDLDIEQGSTPTKAGEPSGEPGGEPSGGQGPTAPENATYDEYSKYALSLGYKPEEAAAWARTSVENDLAKAGGEWPSGEPKPRTPNQYQITDNEGNELITGHRVSLPDGDIGYITDISPDGALGISYNPSDKPIKWENPKNVTLEEEEPYPSDHEFSDDEYY